MANNLEHYRERTARIEEATVQWKSGQPRHAYSWEHAPTLGEGSNTAIEHQLVMQPDNEFDDDGFDLEEEDSESEDERNNLIDTEAELRSDYPRMLVSEVDSLVTRFGSHVDYATWCTIDALVKADLVSELRRNMLANARGEDISDGPDLEEV
jgi:hypothetical protein